jgi:hypothetical protein
MRTIIFTLVLAAFATTATADGWQNPYSGITWNNPMSSLADTMLHNKMNEAMLNASIARSQGRAQPAATTAHPPYTRTDFTPGRQRLVVDAIVGGLTQNAEQRRQLVQAMAAIFDRYEQTVRKHNVAYAVAFLIGASLQVQTGQSLDDAQGEQLAQAINDTLAQNPAFANASATDKQKLYEMCVTLGGLVLLFDQVGKQDPASASAAKALAKQSLAMLGIQ